MGKFPKLSTIDSVVNYCSLFVNTFVSFPANSRMFDSSWNGRGTLPKIVFQFVDRRCQRSKLRLGFAEYYYEVVVLGSVFLFFKSNMNMEI